MASPSIPKPHRKPLQPKNFASATNPKKPNLTIEDRIGKENCEISVCGDQMKLFSQIEAARMRAERLRKERERGELKMREMDAAFERWMGGAERRLNELLVAEMDIRRVVRVIEHRASCARSSAFMSLRAREEEKRWQAAQLQEIGNAAAKRKSEASGSKK